MQKANTKNAIEEYELIKVKIDDLQFDESNPNQLTKEQEEALRKAMTRFGYLVPIIINEEYQIGDGEHRAKLYQKLGLTEIPAYIVPKINDDIERRLLRQTMNKLHGEHEVKMDSSEIALIFQNNKFDDLISLIAQPKESLENILTKYQGIQFQHEDNFDVDKALEDLVPETQLGDIWQLGNHRIICADCSDERSIKKLMDSKKADMVFTDPPYGVDYSEKNKWLNSIAFANRIETPIENDKITDYYEFYTAFLKVLPLQETNTIYITIGYRKLSALLNVLNDLDFHFSQVIVWVKNNHILGKTDYADKHEFLIYCWKGKHEYYGDFDTTVWEINKPLSNPLHPTMKPIELVTRAIRNSSKQESLIFDPFLGSGSTLIACEQTNRICFGCEIDNRYVEVAVKRWETYTGKKGQKLAKQ